MHTLRYNLRDFFYNINNKQNKKKRVREKGEKYFDVKSTC